MEINEIQKQVSELIKKIDSKHLTKGHDAETTFIHIIEEIGEIARELLNEQIGRDELDKKKLSEEISDCIIMLIKLADNYNIDIEEALNVKIKGLKKRFNIK